MFKKKNPVKKVEVKSEDAGVHKININIRPLVTVELHEKRVDGKLKAPKYRISIADRDIIELNEREYHELFGVMFQKMDDSEVMHAIYEKHAMKHAEIEGVEKNIEKMIKESGLGAMLEKLANQ